jgi:putative phosphoribosyl transferase
MRADVDHEVLIETPQARLKGILAVPDAATGIVLFAHGSGSGRMSPRNRFVAATLQQAGLGTLLLDLLEEWESDDRTKVFDIDLLSERLLSATEWIHGNPDTSDLKVGYFGASTGAAAALQAAADPDSDVSAIVSRGGRPDLAMPYLPAVTAPTLLIVGGNDYPVITMNQQAHAALKATKDLVIIPRATHLFEEPGTLEEVARLASDWFNRYLK